MLKKALSGTLAVLLTSAASSAPASKDKKPRPGGSLWERIPINAADAPGRCDASRLHISLNPGEVFTYAKNGSIDLDDQIEGMLRNGRVRFSPWHVLRMIKSSDYYGNREDVISRIEAAIEDLPAEKRVEALGNYAMFLIYVGEFKRVVGYFSPGSRAYKDAMGPGEVDYALGIAYHRLGRNDKALPHAERAYKNLSDAVLDTRWQLMLIASELWGEKFFERKHPAYSTAHIKKFFPKRRWELPFEDATEEIGLSTGPLWGGYGTAAFFDGDGDGWDDLLLERKFFPPRLYRNAGGKLELLPESKLGKPAPCNQLFAYPNDFDGDGKDDIFRNCCNFDGGGPVQLLKNKGDFAFEDVAAEAGLGAAKGGTAACWGDYDLDGKADLVVNGFRGMTRLYRNKGDGRFDDATLAAGLSTPGEAKAQYSFGALGCAFIDNGRRYPDLYVQGWGWHQLYRNQGDGTFKDVTKDAGIGDGSNRRGYMVTTLDYDNDQDMDILVGSYVVGGDERVGVSAICTCSNLLAEEGFSEREMKAGPTIFRNNGDGTFTDMAEKMNFLPLGGMSYGKGDWNNDGWEDVVIGYGGGYMQQDEPFAFYQNDGKGGFVNMTPYQARGMWGKGHGIGFADVRRQGVLDVVLQNGGSQFGDLWPTRYLKNTTKGKSWLQVRLKPAAGTNPSAMGARVKVRAGGMTQTKDLYSGGTFSANIGSLHFGLDKAVKADSIVVEWPNKSLRTTELKDVPADQAIEIDEAAGTWRTLWTASPAPVAKN